MTIVRCFANYEVLNLNMEHDGNKSTGLRMPEMQSA